EHSNITLWLPHVRLNPEVSVKYLAFLESNEDLEIEWVAPILRESDSLGDSSGTIPVKLLSDDIVLLYLLSVYPEFGEVNLLLQQPADDLDGANLRHLPLVQELSFSNNSIEYVAPAVFQVGLHLNIHGHGGSDLLQHLPQPAHVAAPDLFEQWSNFKGFRRNVSCFWRKHPPNSLIIFVMFHQNFVSRAATLFRTLFAASAANHRSSVQRRKPTWQCARVQRGLKNKLENPYFLAECMSYDYFHSISEN
ncbi:hypothetical protein CEXT_352041, partial [Caerostris extrusa]